MSDTMKLSNLPHLTVIKQSGEETQFYAYKINFILTKLNLSNYIIDAISHDLYQYLDSQVSVTTSEIRNLLCSLLTNYEQLDAVNEYESYYQAEKQNFSDAANVQKRIEKLFSRDESVVHENANKDSRVFNTQRDLEAGAASRALGLQMLPPLVAKAHLRGDIHWHDLDYSPVTPATNCCLIDFDNLLTNGYKIGNAWVDSPHSIQTATAQMAQIIANVASSQYGGCSANRIDQLLAPYAQMNYDKHIVEAKQWVVADKRDAYAKEKTRKDIYDAMQALEYEINTMYSSQGQTPFTTVNFGLGTSWIEREIQKAILNNQN
ncbi:Ribonucleotide reductase of class III (anaerobic), large subunit [Leuconostoc pseudomesenteroides 4882]|nr:Ribonucleotide reductase of class III (anaerobic), large subunit [Leuconostoc pseudomesenteroides 4882]